MSSFRIELFLHGWVILSVHHVRLLLLEWIDAFLQNRSCSTQMGNSLSTPCQVASGVPQSFVLGLILFIVNTADYTWDL